jgi:hypothetical protein
MKAIIITIFFFVLGCNVTKPLSVPKSGPHDPQPPSAPQRNDSPSQPPRTVERPNTEPSTQNPPLSQSLVIYEEGKAIVKPGIFDRTCVYGLKRSISDHAPVIYDKIGTWNITLAVNHNRRGASSYLNHTFKINKDDALVDEKGALVLGAEKSEYSGTINAHYEKRLTEIARKIKDIFDEHNLEAMAVQEIASLYTSGLTTKFKDLLNTNGLSFLFPQAPDVTDVALIVRKNNRRFERKAADKNLRVQSYCKDDDKSCIVSAHFSLPADDNKLKTLCQDLEVFASKLEGQGYKHVKIIGDFNVSAQRMAKVCNSWAKKAPSLTTTVNGGKGSSCQGQNTGNITSQNIDIALNFDF